MANYTQAIIEAIAQLSEERNNKKFNWTEDAILCKLRGCNCKGCKFDELHASSYENKKHGCRLKKHVLNLVKTIGKPEGIPEPTYIEDKDEFEYLKNKYSLEILCRMYNCTRAEMKDRLKKCEEHK